MQKKLSHIRREAKAHHERHQHLKKRVAEHQGFSENLFRWFVITFLIVFGGIWMAQNSESAWQWVKNLKPEPNVEVPVEPNEPSVPTPPTIHTDGFRTAVLSQYKLSNQKRIEIQNRINSIPTKGSLLSASANQLFAKAPEAPVFGESGTVSNGVWLTNYLGTGQTLTELNQSKAGGLSKSIVTNYYLGERTRTIESILEKDTRLLGQINSALSVDLFQYLNRSVSRADALDDYVELLTRLQNRGAERIADLNSKINFLSQNATGTETKVNLAESQFFDQLERFNGKDAQVDFNEFVALAESQVEVRAKIGSYQTLKGYYEFFQPTLENMITAIQANREPLIAGVRVVEIQNMQLPLIIRE